MRKFSAAIIISPVVLALCGVSALAAETSAQIDFLSGKVLLNAGRGFAPTKMSNSLKAGDQLLIGKDSTVTVTFNTAQCSVSYAAPSVVTIPAIAPCKPGDTLAAAGNDFLSPANGYEAPIAGAAVDSTVPVTVGLGVAATAFAAATYVAVTPANPPVSAGP